MLSVCFAFIQPMSRQDPSGAIVDVAVVMAAHNEEPYIERALRSCLAQSMDVSAPAIGRYLDALEGAFMLRSLQPMEANVMKRLVNCPRCMCATQVCCSLCWTSAPSSNSLVTPWQARYGKAR